ncbi:FASN_3 protein, partial [Gryllus bimaculatus]
MEWFWRRCGKKGGTEPEDWRRLEQWREFARVWEWTVGVRASIRRGLARTESESSLGRWRLLSDHPEIPPRSGKINGLEKFDASFFSFHFKQAHTMDPQCRLLLERAYEAIVDAGVNPRSLRGKKMGVYVGVCFSESEKTWFYEKLQLSGFGITGCCRAMLANRISYWLGVK